jgi:2-(3-amino-3-carboxypropyl)histidine synthase
MEKKTISEIEKEYDLELDKIVENIKKQKAKRVLLQFPDGMKPYSTVIADEIEQRAGCECIIWMETCYGACDVPNLGPVEKDIDLVIQFGHSTWNYKKSVKIVK